MMKIFILLSLLMLSSVAYAEKPILSKKPVEFPPAATVRRPEKYPSDTKVQKKMVDTIYEFMEKNVF